MVKGVLLINIGTPDSPAKKDVRRFLFRFLNDSLVIDIPFLLQKILVNCIIIPFRVNKSAGLYRKLWTKDGSPLLVHLNKLHYKLQKSIGSEVKVYSAMRYGLPSLKEAMANIKADGVEELVVLPLYPQYSTSTTLSTIRKVTELTDKMALHAKIRFVEYFHNAPEFIEAFAHQVLKYDIKSYDHIVFSYHGLPMRQINKVHPGCNCSIESFVNADEKCYRGACYETTRLLANKLEIPEANYSVGFQSRLSKNWLSPFTDELLKEQLSNGNKRILVISPSFVADCLETIVEIGDYREEYIANGGEQLDLVESLNSSDKWVETVKVLLK